MIYQKLMTKSNKSDLYWDLAELASGIALAVFFYSHMLNDSTILIGEWAFDAVGDLMHTLHIHNPVIVAVFLLIVFHMVVAGRRIPNRLGDIKIIRNHIKLTKHTDTFLWVFQIVSGAGIGFMAAAHIWTMATHHEISAQISGARVQNPVYTLFYLVLLTLATGHTGVGLYRQIVKWLEVDRNLVKKVLGSVSAGILFLSIITLIRFLSIKG